MWIFDWTSYTLEIHLDHSYVLSIVGDGGGDEIFEKVDCGADEYIEI